MIEKLFQIIAPDTCLVCQQEGCCICKDCEKAKLVTKKPACPICNSLNNDWRTCNNCYRKTDLRGAYVAYRYESEIKDLIWAMKFENKRSIANYFAEKLGLLEGVVCYVPSDGRTRRTRGYDQAELIAKRYAKINNLPLERALLRLKHTRQVGKGRAERIKNISGNFLATKDMNGKNVILIDDVITTGATVSECAKVLKQAGAKNVWALAVAKR